MTAPPKRPARAVPAPPPLRVLNKAFDDFDADYDPTEDYAEIASRVRQEEDAW